ncbi:MAG: NAD(P)/FAD-dependent oxidoreductase [Hyphomicrobiales bacterium]|nr:NAD(P)/FAD-dependent oxidoreductase [Hyphomicrobiales bacterium]MCP5370391.1 NAD(P)/FAD-dependent oxidoreductase [Hyphomicrobiales bacterium]
MTQAGPGTSHRTDIAIIGAGPVGLFAVFECGMLNMRCHVVDALEAAGGQCSALYPEKPIYDIPGYPQIMAGDLVARLEEQAAPFEPAYHFAQQVVSLTRGGDGRWLLETSAGTHIDAAAVLVAAGVGAFGPNRPPMDGLPDFEASGAVRYLVSRREEFRGKRIVIAGGGDSAVDWALSLAELAAHVAVIHRRPKFRAAPESVSRLQALAADGRVELVIPFQPAALDGADGRLAAVIAKDLDGNERRLEADFFLPFFGLAQNLGPIAQWGLNLDFNHVQVSPDTCATNLAGVFAIGDIATYPGKLKLILTGFAEAAAAAHAARKVVYPDEELHFEYSTSRGVPGH